MEKEEDEEEQENEKEASLLMQSNIHEMCLSVNAKCDISLI